MRKPYKTDLTDAQWEFIQPLLPIIRAKNGFPVTNLREVINTILYQTRYGVPWNALPHDLAPRSTTFDYYCQWSKDGTLQAILDAARRTLRTQAGRAAEPSAAAIDSQSVKAAAGVQETVGTDGGKLVKGRKRHIVTDTLGLLLCVAVTAANIADGRAAPEVLRQLPLPEREKLRVIFADRSYHNRQCAKWFRQHPQIRLEIVSRPKGVRGFVPLPKRWVVERTFGWLMLNLRCVREYEKTSWSSESRVKFAALGMMMRRLKDGPDIQGGGANAANQTPLRSRAKSA